MQLPNYEKAQISKKKICEYLLNDKHPEGSSKAKYFQEMGYTINNWQQFERDLKEQLPASKAESTEEIEYGVKYGITHELKGPSGTTRFVKSIWIIREENDFPELITAYPGSKQ